MAQMVRSHDRALLTAGLLAPALALALAGCSGGADDESIGGGSTEPNASDFDTGEPTNVEVEVSGAVRGSLEQQRSILSSSVAFDCCGMSVSYVAFTEGAQPPEAFTAFYIDIDDLRRGETGSFSAEIGVSGGSREDYFQNDDCSVEVTLHEPSEADTFVGDAYRVEGHGGCSGSLKPYDALMAQYETDGVGEVTVTAFSFSAMIGWRAQ